METVRERLSGEVIAVDVKTVRGSKDVAGGKRPLHVVSAWANENQLVLGQIAVEEKSNEITAIHYLEQEVQSQPKNELKAAGQWAQMKNKDHGRIEIRTCYVTEEIDWLNGKED